MNAMQETPKSEKKGWWASIPTPVKVLGVLASPIVMIGVIALLPSLSEPTLTREDFDAALAKWKEHGPKTYEMTIDFRGYDTQYDYQVEVAEGKIARLVKNGAEIPTGSDDKQWSIDAQMELIAKDLEERIAGANNATLVAEFHPKYGYPVFYQRQEYGSPVNYKYRITSFTPK